MTRRPAASPLLPATALLVLAACGGALPLARPAPPPAIPVAVIEDPGEDVLRPAARPRLAGALPATVAPVPARPQARTAEALDATSAAERAAARAVAPGQGRRLGETLAGLGPPAEQGFWLRTGLVDRVRAGRAETASGAAVAVELRPSGGPAGGGSQISLAAMRALDLPLTGLATLAVFVLD